MSTNSSIAVCLDDGSVRSVYCHWDGFIHHNGKLLLKFWNSQELAESLTSLGNMSILGKRLEPIGNHTFKNPEKDTCLFYGRDRKDVVGINAKVWKSLVDYFNNCDFREYNYLFNNGNWLVNSEKGFDDDNFRVLSIIYNKK
jgi:hypothetical protein